METFYILARQNGMIEKIVDILLMKAKNDKKFQKKLSKKLKKL